MKKKLTSKLMLKIVSVIVAFLFWLVIINITDPTTSKKFYDIPVRKYLANRFLKHKNKI